MNPMTAYVAKTVLVLTEWDGASHGFPILYGRLTDEVIAEMVTWVRWPTWKTATTPPRCTYAEAFDALRAALADLPELWRAVDDCELRMIEEYLLKAGGGEPEPALDNWRVI